MGGTLIDAWAQVKSLHPTMARLTRLHRGTHLMGNHNVLVVDTRLTETMATAVSGSAIELFD
jgi:hypothetical protein